MKLYSLGYGGKACYFDVGVNGELKYEASSAGGEGYLSWGAERGTDIYVAHEQTDLPGGEVTSGIGHSNDILLKQ